MSLTGTEKAAMIMMALKQETSSKLLGMLEDDEIRELSQAMSSLGKVQMEVIENTIEEFNTEITETLNFMGNIENTEKILAQSLPADKVASILEEIRGPAGRSIWDKLGNISEEVLANYLKEEHPQTAAVILTKLSAAQASKVLGVFDEEKAFEIMKRMLSMGSIKKEVLEKIERILRTEFIGKLTKTQKQNSTQIIAEIFNNFDRTQEAKFMEKLESYNSNSAESVKNLMFTFEDLKKLNSEGAQSIMKLIDKTKLPLALKGAPEEIRSMFINNMSQRAAKLLLEEIEALGPVKLKDVDEAQSSIIAIAKDLINKGEIEISNGDEEEELLY